MLSRHSCPVRGMGALLSPGAPPPLVCFAPWQKTQQARSAMAVGNAGKVVKLPLRMYVVARVCMRALPLGGAGRGHYPAGVIVRACFPVVRSVVPV